MSLVELADKDADTCISLTDDPGGLKRFLDPRSAAAIWRRTPPEDVQSWLDGLEPDQLPSGRVILSPDKVSDTVGHLFDIYHTPEGSQRDWLHADIVALADLFAALTSSRFLRLRLDVVTTNACRKFHVDAIASRLVCTYRGTGTQYGISSGREDPERVFTVQTGAPILLRGTLWPPQPDAGLLHRSPPIEGTGETRLVLVLDPITDPDDEM